MKVDCLVAEIGSTTTIVNAFSFSDKTFLGRGMHATTADTDVTIGVKAAIDELRKTLQAETLDYEYMFASSSAAGGLRMTVSGLVYEMTVKAARQAASNAGANIHLITSGDLEADDLEQIKDIRPNIVLVSGGTDYGDKNIAYNNLLKIESLKLGVPIIYAGNVENHYRIKKYFKTSDQREFLTLVDNVYPRVDFMNINPVRKVIYKTFEDHIIHAKGMERIKEIVNGSIMPTPGSVMESTMFLYEMIGNVLTIDVGGATTDIHSVTAPSEDFEEYLEGEPKEKRTVEGDLGVFINHKNVIDSIGKEALRRTLGITPDELEELIENYKYKPETELEHKLVFELTRHCVFVALDRHIGDLRNVYTSSGQKIIPDGRDVSQVQSVILTGGALVNLKNTESIIHDYIKSRRKKMVPIKYDVYKDSDYIMASLGVLSLKFSDAAKILLQKSIGVKW